MRRILARLSAISALATAVSLEAQPPELGVVVEEARRGYAADRAGIRPGDILSSWYRAPAPPADPDPTAGELETPFDLARAETEEAPRGEVRVVGSRRSRPMEWLIPPGQWRLETRPRFPSVALGRYLEAKKGWEDDVEGSRAVSVDEWKGLAGELAAEAPALAIWLWWRAGGAELALDRPEEAESTFEMALAAGAERGDRERLAVLRNLCATQLVQHRRLEQAAALSQAALSDLQHLDGISFINAEVLDTLATVAWQRGDLAAAEVQYQRALAIRQDGGRKSAAVAKSLDNLAAVAGTRGELAAAEAYSLEALSIMEELAPESLEVAVSLNNLGAAAGSEGDLEAAEEHHRRALNIRERLAPESLYTVHSLHNVGWIAWYRGDLAGAEELNRRALSILEALPPQNLDIAASLNTLGVVASARGNFAAAEDYFRRALRLEEELAPGSLRVAEKLDNLGKVARHRGDLKMAGEYHLRAHVLTEELAPDSLVLAQSLHSLGEAAEKHEDVAAAATYHQRALSLRTRLAPDSLDVAHSLGSLAGLSHRNGELEEAKTLSQEALAIRRRLAPRSLAMAESLKQEGDLLFDLGDTESARQRYGAALDLVSSIAPFSSTEAEALYDLARVEAHAGKTTEALRLGQRALAALETQAGRLGGGGEIRGSFFAVHDETYRFTLELLVAAEDHREAFHVLERSRAQGLLALLAERDLLFADLPAELDRERRLANTTYDRAYERLHQLSGEITEGEHDALREELEVARRRQQEIQTKIRQTPSRVSSNLYPEPLDLEGTRQLLEPGELLLSFASGDEHAFLFVVGAETDPFRLYRLELSRELLTTLVSRFRASLQPAVPAGQARHLAASLTEHLLSPAKAAIAAASRLIVIADGPLHYLPFGALLDPASYTAPLDPLADEARFLIEGRPVAVVASATVLAELRRRGRQHPHRTLVAFGNPAYGDAPRDRPGQEVHLRTARRRGLDLSPLPFSSEEVESLAALFRESAHVYTGAEATEARAKSVDRTTAILHFATHGLIDEDFPLESSLALSIPEAWREGQENGLLQVWEIYEQVRLEADLVTLSACETALGKEMAGEGILGLTRAFQFAGARSVLASLWAVSDQSTTELMRRFYRHLKRGLPRDEALRQAQIELLRRPLEVGGRTLDATHPFDWAGFQLYGDWR